jgi:hypothetical protein
MLKKQIIPLVIASGLALSATQASAFIYGDINGGYGVPVSTGSTNGSTSQSDGSFGYEANVGIYFLPIAAVEVGYNGFNELKYNNTAGNSRTSLNGWHTALKLQIPLPLNIFVMAKGGLGSLTRNGIQGSGSKTNYNAYWALGGGWNLNNYIYFQGAYTQMQGANSIPTMGLFSAGVGINLL